MKVRATLSFAGQISIGPGEVRDVPEDIAAPLLACGYLVEEDETAAKKPTKKPVK